MFPFDLRHRKYSGNEKLHFYKRRYCIEQGVGEGIIHVTWPWVSWLYNTGFCIIKKVHSQCMQKLFVPAKQVNKMTDLWQVTATWLLESPNNCMYWGIPAQENKGDRNSDGGRELLGEPTRGVNYWSDQIVIRDWAWLSITSGWQCLARTNKHREWIFLCKTL